MRSFPTSFRCRICNIHIDYIGDKQISFCIHFPEIKDKEPEIKDDKQQ